MDPIGPVNRPLSGLEDTMELNEVVNGELTVWATVPAGVSAACAAASVAAVNAAAVVASGGSVNGLYVVAATAAAR